ncbi:MAG: TIGR00725 family protein [Actinomycetota bacterium]|nr:TIGR00725 family protein [Actinomycetota bacterium]
MPVYVAVLGPADTTADVLATAETVGRELARRGAVVVTGGRAGVMEAACRGAAEEGGLTVGILPGPDRSDANGYVKVGIPTGMGELRNGLVARAGDAVIAIDGGYGTLSEIGFALRIGRPVVGLSTWEDDAIAVARDPVDAVEQALSLAGAVS